MSRIKKENIPFCQIPNALLEDARLTYKAKGLYAYMASRPDGWHFYETQLSKVSKEGKDAVKAAMDELVACGWVLREEEPARDGGRFDGYLYTILHRCGKTATVEPQRINRNGKPATNNTYKENNTDGIILTDTPPTPQGDVCRFDDFWDLYPAGGRKVAKKQCAEKWKRGNLDNIADEVLNGLRRWIISEDWEKENGRFIPAPIVWLNQQRWGATPKAGKNALYDALVKSGAEINF